MRILFGIIVGFFLAIGVAYIHDANLTAASTNPNANVAERPMVNWDVVDTSWQKIRTSVQIGWRKLQSIG
jgi:hypothetical protein